MSLRRGGALVEARPGQVTRGLDMVLRRGAGTLLPVSIALPMGTEPGVDALPNPHLGELVALDAPRFSADAAATGSWRPVDFLFDVGAGIYFLEPDDPHRIPVLFVHGALGEPNDFGTLIAQLDPRAQDQARRVLGFDASYRGVLESPLAALQLSRALDAFAVGAAAP